MILQIGKIVAIDLSVEIGTFLLEIKKEILSIIPIKYSKKKLYLYVHSKKYLLILIFNDFL
ncbi:hypothetical protein [Borreliella valaisiana]|uniref:hypothetical protein n=1 Tax=Borreliella valaisiana TaxID=62088 RepID=UPI002ED64613